MEWLHLLQFNLLSRYLVTVIILKKKQKPIYISTVSFITVLFYFTTRLEIIREKKNTHKHVHGVLLFSYISNITKET